jgi:hypothetical protein
MLARPWQVPKERQSTTGEFLESFTYLPVHWPRYVLTDRANTDKIPLLTPGYGRAASKDGSVFMWNFPLLGTYWSGADIAIQHIGKEIGGVDKLPIVSMHVIR